MQTETRRNLARLTGWLALGAAVLAALLIYAANALLAPVFASAAEEPVQTTTWQLVEFDGVDGPFLEFAPVTRTRLSSSCSTSISWYGPNRRYNLDRMTANATMSVAAGCTSGQRGELHIDVYRSRWTVVDDHEYRTVAPGTTWRPEVRIYCDPVGGDTWNYGAWSSLGGQTTHGKTYRDVGCRP